MGGLYLGWGRSVSGVEAVCIWVGGGLYLGWGRSVSGVEAVCIWGWGGLSAVSGLGAFCIWDGGGLSAVSRMGALSLFLSTHSTHNSLSLPLSLSYMCYYYIDSVFVLMLPSVIMFNCECLGY